MNEKQLLDRLKREADTVPLPETLSPEAIERMLLAAQKNQAAQSKNPTEPASAQSAASSDAGSPHTKGGSNMKKHTSFYRCAMRYGSLAAVFVLGVTVPVSYTHLDVYKRQDPCILQPAPQDTFERTEKRIRSSLWKRKIDGDFYKAWMEGDRARRAADAGAVRTAQ